MFRFTKKLFGIKKMTPYDYDTFEQWFNAQGIKHFKASEFTSYFEREKYGVKNEAPPRKLWENILPTLRVVDKLRDVMASPITINSSYRGKIYNQACGGAERSQHLRFTALDISVADATPHEVFSVLKGMRGEGEFAGGLGRYSTFVHIDTRGINATW